VSFDPYRSAMSRAAVERIACAAVSLLSLALPWRERHGGSGFDLLSRQDVEGVSLLAAHNLGCVLVGGMGAYLCAAASSFAAATSSSQPLTSSGAHHLWGVTSRIELVGLLIWSLALSWAMGVSGTGWKASGAGVCLDLAGLVGCIAIEVVDLPRRLWGARAQSTASRVDAARLTADPSEPVRSAFAWIARRRLCAAAVGFACFALPWSYSDVVVQVDGTGPPGWCKPRRGVLGIEMLFGTGDESHTTAWVAFTAFCILATASIWTLQRSRWPEARRSSQMEAFAGWFGPLPLHLLALMLWYASIGNTTRFGPLLIGAWLSLAALLYSALLTLALSPLVLFRALRRRAASDMRIQLEERNTP